VKSFSQRKTPGTKKQDEKKKFLSVPRRREMNERGEFGGTKFRENEMNLRWQGEGRKRKNSKLEAKKREEMKVKPKTGVVRS